MEKKYSFYRQTEINTSNPLKLVVMLYDGAINFLKKSIDYAEKKDIKNKNIYANKARDIIVELNNHLNIEAGGEIAKNLKGLYFFINRHLLISNMNNNLQGIKEVIQMLSNLRDAWQEIGSQRVEMGDAPNSLLNKQQIDSLTYHQRGLRV